jgi:hypothetical protein
MSLRRAIVDPTLARNKYVNKDGESITLTEFRRLRADKSYVTIREFENDKLYAAVLWLGEVEDAKSVPREHWKLYGLVVMNIVTHDVDGAKYPEPLRARDPALSNRFRTEQEAIEAYEDALVRFADCSWVPSSYNSGEHHFIEKNNKLAPPPPDAPSAKAGEVQFDPAIVGSW